MRTAPSTIFGSDRIQRFQSAIGPALAVILTILGCIVLFKGYMWSPNKFMFAFGGDALVIYYDMIFHVAFDHGPTLQAMNYPYGELIFLTDAQGAFATLLRWIQTHLFPVADHIPGIIHGLNLYLLPVSSVMVYFILRHFQVRQGISVVFAVLITMLSPAILRIGGHFGLAYPFLIPMAMLWSLRKYHHPKLEIRDAVVLAVLTFFSFNNPYTGLNAAGFLIIAGMIMLIISFRDIVFRFKGLLVTGMGILPVLVPYLYFRVHDPVDDRIQEQWGFFFYNASLEGLLFPQRSILFQWLKSFEIKVQPLEFEQMINLGIVTLILVMVFFLRTIWQWLRRRKSSLMQKGGYELGIMMASACLMFLVAANNKILPLNTMWFEEHLGPLLMFKASGRLAWPLYFAMSILGIVFLDRVLHSLKMKSIPYGLVILLAGTWAYEIHTYVGRQFVNVHHDNFFHPKAKAEITDLVTRHHIDTTAYQAIVVVPKMMAWTDMFLSEINWAAQFYSMRISAATGLPMISAMLSRMSIGQSAEAIQMLSHPIIEKDLLKKLPNRKDLLLVVGSGYASLAPGEQYLIGRATPVFQSESYSLYKLSPDSLLESASRKEAQHQYTLHQLPPDNIWHVAFDETPADLTFYGPGSYLAEPGPSILVNQPVPAGPDTQFVFSAWTRIDHHQPGVGDWDLRIKNPDGTVRSHQWIETRRLNDIQDMWIRTEAVFHGPPGSIIEATLNSNKPIYVDEIWVYPVGKIVIHDIPGDPHFLFNGYKVSKPTVPDQTQ